MRAISRRELLRFVGIGMGAAVLAGCAGAPTAAPAATEAPKVEEKPTEAPAATAAPPKTGEKARLVAVDTGDGEALRRTFKPFLEQHPDIEIEVIGVAWEGFDEKVDLLIAGGDAPAIWRPGAKRGYRYYADKGLFPDIGPWIERDNLDVSDFYETVYDFVKWEGKQRGFPAAHYLSSMYYNKTLFESAGVPLPPSSWDDESWTWDAFLEAVNAITQRSDDPLKTVWGCGRCYCDRRHLAWVFGGDYFPKEGYVTGKPTTTTVNTPEVIDGFQFAQDLIYKHQVQPTPAEGQIISAAGIDLFLSGKVGILHNANWAFNTYGEIEEFEWSIAPIPGGRYARKELLYPDQWMMFKDQKYPDAAWEALKYVASPDGLRIYYLGTDKLGGIPSRKSLAAEWTDAAVKATKLDASVLDSVINKGIEVAGQVTASHAIIKFAEIHDVAIAPNLDNLFLNKISGKEAAALMEPKILEILRA